MLPTCPWREDIHQNYSKCNLLTRLIGKSMNVGIRRCQRCGQTSTSPDIIRSVQIFTTQQQKGECIPCKSRLMAISQK